MNAHNVPCHSPVKIPCGFYSNRDGMILRILKYAKQALTGLSSKPLIDYSSSSVIALPCKCPTLASSLCSPSNPSLPILFNIPIPVSLKQSPFFPRFVFSHNYHLINYLPIVLISSRYSTFCFCALSPESGSAMVYVGLATVSGAWHTDGSS